MDIKELLNSFMLDRCIYTHSTTAQDIFINYSKGNIFHTIHNGEFCILEKVDQSKGAVKSIVDCFNQLGDTPEEFKVYKVLDFDKTLVPSSKAEDKFSLIKKYVVSNDNFEKVCGDLEIYACRKEIDTLHDVEIEENEKLMELVKSFTYEQTGTIELSKQDIIKDIIEIVDNKTLYNICPKNSLNYKQLAGIRAFYV